jgi:hypothetical protein
MQSRLGKIGDYIERRLYHSATISSADCTSFRGGGGWPGQPVSLSVCLPAGARCSVYCALSDGALEAHCAGARYFGAACEPAAPARRALDRGAAGWLWHWSVVATECK